MRILDANILVRYFTKDDPTKAAACEVLIRRVSQGIETVRVCESVIAEVVWVLSSPRSYAVSRHDIRQLLTAVIRLPGVRISNKRLCLRALDLYSLYPQLDFADAVSAAFAETETAREVYSYDTDFDHVPTIMRIEP